MKTKYKYLFGLMLVLLIQAISSCNEKEEIDSVINEGETVLTLNISPATRSEDFSDVETIESVRLVLIETKTGKVVANEFHTFPQGTPVKKFSTTYNVVTVAGDYKAYLIANEEYIENYRVENDDTDYSNIRLTDILGGYNEGRSGFETFIMALCYKPNPQKPLPQSSVYDVKLENKVENYDLYLVNATTKFEINIYNYRNDEVTVNRAFIDKIADQCYLMADIDEGYEFKDGLHWIDWLRQVSDDTNLHPDLDDTEESNDLINEKWGWLTHYNLPAATLYLSEDLTEKNQPWVIAAATGNTADIPTPGELHKGPYYFPESKYIPETGSAQSYTLEFDVVAGSEIKSLRRELGFVKTLFRNTYVVIDVDIYAGAEEIYAEIIKWGSTGLSYGTISPE